MWQWQRSAECTFSKDISWKASQHNLPVIKWIIYCFYCGVQFSGVKNSNRQSWSPSPSWVAWFWCNAVWTWPRLEGLFISSKAREESEGRQGCWQINALVVAVLFTRQMPFLIAQSVSSIGTTVFFAVHRILSRAAEFACFCGFLHFCRISWNSVMPVEKGKVKHILVGFRRPWKIAMLWQLLCYSVLLFLWCFHVVDIHYCYHVDMIVPLNTWLPLEF